jgi:glucokinase
MPGLRAITQDEMNGINRAAVLELLRRSGPRSRAAIAKELGLSRATVRRRVDELLARQLVRATGGPGRGGGRPGAAIEFNSHGQLCLSLDLGGTKFYGAVTDLAGDFVYEHTVSLHGSKGEASYQLAEQLLAELLAEAHATGKPVLGIGVGAPGVMRQADGVVVASANLEWAEFPLRQRLRDRFHLPVVVDNDVNLAALGEAWFGAGLGHTNLVWINIGTGIGAGLILEGALYRGTHEAAGEIGYLIPGLEFLGADYPGFGALELQAAGIGIAQRATVALKKAHGRTPEGEITAKTLAEAYHHGDPWAITLMGETLDYLAIMLGATVAFLDPDLIVLGGGVMHSLDVFVGELAHRLESKGPRIPPIVVSALGQRAAALGAIISLLQQAADYAVVRRLS